MRTDLYSTIHKAQRFHMFELANAIGHADPASEEAAGRIRARVRGIIEHLRDHAANEETYIHPLFDAAGDEAAPLRHEHDDLEKGLAALEQALDAHDGRALYSAYAAFLGRYLLHLEEEEEAQARVLWRDYDDDALRAVLDRFKAERPRDQAAADFAFMLPALNAPELVRLFQSMKLSASSEAFSRAWEQGARLVEPSIWRHVADALGR